MRRSPSRSAVTLGSGWSRCGYCPGSTRCCRKRSKCSCPWKDVGRAGCAAPCRRRRRIDPEERDQRDVFRYTANHAMQTIYAHKNVLFQASWFSSALRRRKVDLKNDLLSLCVQNGTKRWAGHMNKLRKTHSLFQLHIHISISTSSRF